jgi:hypothetical protein
MKFTPYMEECICVLEEMKSYPTDLLLVCLVRLQLICNEAAAMNWNSSDEGNKAPGEFYMKAFNFQLEKFKQFIPPELQSSRKCISLI